MATVQIISNGEDAQAIDGPGVDVFALDESVPSTHQIRPSLFFSIEGFGCGEADTASLQGTQRIEVIAP